MKNKVLLVTEHSALYWDVTISSLEKRLDLDVAYCERRVKSKMWNNDFKKQIDIEKFGFLNILKLVLKNNKVIFGGRDEIGMGYGK